jgi:hypothetical protein
MTKRPAMLHFSYGVASPVRFSEPAWSCRVLHESARFPEMPQYQAKESVSLGLDLALVGPIYWNNLIHTMTDDSQYRFVGWWFEFGLRSSQLPFYPRSWPGIEAFYQHHSQHILEDRHPSMRFPVNDSIGFRIHFVTPAQW